MFNIALDLFKWQICIEANELLNSQTHNTVYSPYIQAVYSRLVVYIDLFSVV